MEESSSDTGEGERWGFASASGYWVAAAAAGPPFLRLALDFPIVALELKGLESCVLLAQRAKTLRPRFVNSGNPKKILFF